MSRLGQRDHEFAQLIGAYFHQDALLDAGSVDEIIDEYLRDVHPAIALDAAETGQRVLAAGLDDAALEALLRRLGFSFVVTGLGYVDHAAFVAHVVQRLDAHVGAVAATALAVAEPESMRALDELERDALSALLSEALGAENALDADDVETVVAAWAGGVPTAATLAAARSAERALRDGPLLDDELLELLLDMGLGFDPIDDHRIDLNTLLDGIDRALSLALGEQPRSAPPPDDAAEDPSDA